MMASVADQGFQLEVCESGLDPHKIADGEVDDDGKAKRTGTMWTASAHILTAIIGSGILSMSWAVAQLGWIMGLCILLIFSCITFYTSSLLADCYRFPNTVTGKRNYTYMEAVKSYLGGTKYKACGFVQYINLIGISVGYTVTASISMVKGHSAPCKFSHNPYMIGLGIIEIFLSQIPNIDKLAWLSTLAAIMSFGYASIGTGLAFAKVISGQGGRTSLTGVKVGEDLTAADKMWTMFRAIGDMAFAFGYSQILIEVQDTLRSSPPENKEMKKANMVGVFSSTSVYLICSCLGYAAFGNRAPGNMLTGFGFYEPFWLVDLANVFIVVHLVGAYQVLSQPVFSVVESWASMRWPKSKFVTEEYPIGIGSKNFKFSINLFRLIWRTIFVVMATILAMAFPFFNDIIALLGAIGFWPLTVYFPVEMYIAQTKINRRTIRWFVLQLLNLVCLLVSIAAVCGSIQGISRGLRTYKLFTFEE